MDTPERGILRNAGKNEHRDEEANLGAVKERDGLQSGESSGRDGKAMKMATLHASDRLHYMNHHTNKDHPQTQPLPHRLHSKASPSSTASS